MPQDPNAAIEITGFSWVPRFARGHVRDYRIRWALEEIGLSYRTRLYDGRKPRPQDYLAEQPFGQVPAFIEGDVHMFESGAIVLHLGERSETLLPADTPARARALSWSFAALNTMEPPIFELVIMDLFAAGETWVEDRRPSAEAAVRERLGQLSVALGDKDRLEGRFTAGDLLMVSALRVLKADLLGRHANLAAYVARGEERPAFARAISAQMADFIEPA